MILYIAFAIFSTALAFGVEQFDGDIYLASNSMAKLASRMYTNLYEQKGNIVISSMSLNYALTATSLATSGNTLRQLQTALILPDDPHRIRQSYRVFTALLKENKEILLVTKYFVDWQVPLRNNFVKYLTEEYFFLINIETTDFSNHPEVSRLLINKYIYRVSNKLVPELYAPGSISSYFTAIILNGLTFTASWLHPFKVHSTAVKPFYELRNKTFVNMMTQLNRFNYGEDYRLNAQLLELPLKGGYSVAIILPRSRKGIRAVENQIRLMDRYGSPFVDIFNNLRSELVRVHLPRFNNSFNIDLVNTLNKIGIKDLFTANANFSKATDVPFRVNDVRGKNLVNVDENGVISSSMTTEDVNHQLHHHSVVEWSWPSGIKLFNANRPFIYILRVQKTGTPIIVGRFSNSGPKIGFSHFLFFVSVFGCLHKSVM